MNDKFDLDKEIVKLVSETEVLPESIKIKTQSAYEEIRSMNKHNKKATTKKWMVAASLLAATIIIVQTPLFADIKALFFGGNYSGVEAAINNGELQKLEGIDCKSNGIMLEVTDALIDPTIIHLRLRLTAESPELLKKLKDNKQTTQFVEQFNIIDDKGRVIQEVREDGVYTPPFINDKGEEVYLLSSSSEQVNTANIDKGEVVIDLIFNSSTGNYTDIKGVTLQSNQLMRTEGDWKLNIVFPSEMLNVTGATYQVTTPNNLIEVESAIAMKTGIKIDFIIKAPVDENVIFSTITTANGQVFTSGRTGGMESTPDGESISLTFEALETDLGDTFTLSIPTLTGTNEQITLTKTH